MKKVLAILRAEQFSPNSVEKDRAVMMATVALLRAKGCEVTVLSETELCSDDISQGDYSAVLSMGRLPSTLRQLQAMAVPVVNSPEGVARCARSRLEEIMAAAQIPTAPAEGEKGYWLKRGDAAAQSKGDVVFTPDRVALEREIEKFRQRGIDEYTVSAHVEGDVVKFYGVLGTGFFRYYYPTDDGDTKFGDEARNGRAMHYPFETMNLQQASERLAVAVGVAVYGGDCIVRKDGTFCIIDFNDWPSFSRCRAEAAEAIAGLI